MNKESLRTQLLAALERECDNIRRAAMDARNEAIHEESRPQNKYDMHSQEAAYLAEGQARLAAELQANLAAYQALPISSFAGRPIDLGALVGLEQRGKTLWYLLGPRSGGLEFTFENKQVVVVTPASPMGSLLLGKREGDEVKTPAKPQPVTWRVVSVV